MPPPAAAPIPDEPPPKSAEEVAIALQIRQHALFKPIDAHVLATTLALRIATAGIRLEWALLAIDDCAAKHVGQGLKSEALQGKLVGFVLHAKGPRAIAAQGARQEPAKPGQYDWTKDAPDAKRAGGGG